jgi:GNAT superfamily N-acetyltransferase
VEISYRWRGEFTNDALNALHAEGFSHRVFSDDWIAQLHDHSLGWVCAYDDTDLVGFVNVAWDGGFHAFVLDMLVAATHRRRGVGTELVAIASAQARGAGCEWLHVDFDPELRDFYIESCGFTATGAGLIAL